MTEGDSTLVVNTQYSIEMVYYRIIHLNPIKFY